MESLPFKPLEKVIDLALEASIRQLDYIINYKDHEQELKEHIKTLESNKITVDEQVKVAEDNAKEITPTARDWLHKVATKLEESKEFHDDNTLEFKTSCYSGGCSSGALPFLWHRRQLGRKAKKILAPAIKELNQEAPNILANISLPPAVTFADINPLDGDYLEFESRKGIIEKILEQLKDSTVRMVGLHGPSGVGKTSLVKQIAKQAGDSKLFDKVVMAIVKKDPDLLKVQQDIADGLRLTFGNEGENGRATLLRKRLKQENTLVVLDDLWDELDLNKIGILFDDDDVVSSHVTSNERNDSGSKKEGEEKMASDNSLSTTRRGCKILFTSRYKEVLRRKINVKEKFIFSVPELDVKDTLTLFKKVVGMSNEIPKFKPETLKNYCAGLPMAVIIVGRSLMHKSESEWEGELERLKNQQGSNEVQKYMENHVKMGYDHLESEELKSIFLVCAQMYHQSLIVDLVKYCYGLGILNDVHTLRGARQSISNSIQMLKDSGLLDSISNDNFNMHDIVRDAALSIAWKNQNLFTLRNNTLDVWPHKEQLERYSAIYLHKCHIVDGLPERVNCPRLTFFYIDCDGSTLKIPDTFFEGMEELRVLVLSGIHLQSLPSSIKCLPNLRMLCLEKCTLGDLSVLNHLRKLRILSLSGSRIEDWPTHLDGLSKLQFLDISNCFISSSTRSLSLSSFPNLEELYIENSLTQMEVEGQINHSQISALSELKHLHQLNTLDVYIPSAELLPADLFFHELNDYKIVIGDFETISIADFKMPKRYEASRSLALQLEPGMDIHSLKGVKLLFKGVVNFLLGELHGVQNVFYELNLNGFPDLKHFSIVNNNDIEYIVNSMELSQPHDAFPSLEFLSLFNLKNIKKICCSPITNSSFSKLKIIKVKMCPQLKSIFFFYIVEFLTSLETIDVSECDSLQAVVSKEEGSNKVVLHKLCSLTLQKLPSFVSFYNNADMLLEPESMEKQARITDDIGIVPAEDEQSSTTSFSLFDENVEIPNLESLKLLSIKIHSIWSDRISNDWFQNLIKLTLENCNLTYLCSLSIARSLNKLKSISISKCSLMEKLFISEENNNGYSKDCIFPKLEEIQLSRMEMLKEIWPCEDEARADSFSSLISVDISQCNKIDKIFPSHMKCLSLKSLKVYSCEWVEFIFKSRLPSQQSDTNKSALLEVIDLGSLPYLKQVWSEDPKGVVNFTNVQSIKIYSCNTLSNVLPASIAKDLGKLESISIYLCRNLEEIIACDGGTETSSEALEFPEVVSMLFSNLPSIRCFYKGRHIVECPKLKQLTMIGCSNLKIFKIESANEEETAFLSAEKVTSKLEHLTIDSKGVEWLMSNTRKYRFTSLKDLYLKDWQSDNDETLYCFLHTIPNLQIFQLGDDYNIREFVPSGNTAPKQRLGTVLLLKELTLNAWMMEDIGFERDPALQRSLHRLKLHCCYKLRRLAHSSVSFTHLTYLQVSYCKVLKTLMTCSTAKSLVQLTTLKVKYCDQLNEIVTKDEQENDEGIQIVFANLITIQLKDLTNLTSFCSNWNCEFSVPLLEKLILTECPKMKTFTAKHITTPKLQSVLGEEEKGYWKGDLNATTQMLFVEKVNLLFQSLEVLSFDMRDAMLTWQLKSQILEFGYSKKRVEEVLFEEKPKAYYVQLLSHLPLKGLSISCLYKLKSIGLEHSWIHPILDNIQTLKVNWCSDIKNLVPSKVSFSSLTKLVVNYCNGLLYLFTSSAAESLSQLKHMEISYCDSMREIICKEDDESNENIIFEQLQVLHLEELPMLRWLYSGKRTLCFPSLQHLSIFGRTLWRMTTFCPHIHIINLNSVKLRSGQNWNAYEVQWEDDVDTTIRKINNKEIIGLRESLYFQDMWRGSLKVPEAYFGNLESLIVHQCEFLSQVIPLHLLPFLNNMQKLEVQKCSYVKTIFDVKCITKDKTLLPIKFSLKELVLEKLPNLDSIWNEDPDGVLHFQLIEQVHVDTCKSLTSLFPKSVGKALLNLKNLELKHCKSLVEIIAGIETTPERAISNPFKFPRLTSMTLLDLPSFNCFYCSLHCVLLKTLNAHDDDPQIEDQVCFKEVTPKLTNLLFGEREAKMIGHEECDGSHFGDINVSDMQGFNVELESDELPYTFLQKVSCIKTLQVKNSSIKEILCSKRPSLDCTQFLPHLKELKLASLSELISIGFERSWIRESSILKTLVTLEVKSCSGLTSLVSSPVCFSNLTQLSVSKCDSMIYLFTSATAKSLTQLKKIEISNCKSMEWIMSNEGEESIHDEIVFEQLQELRFESLKNLRRFYNGGFALSFPSLEKLKVIKCNRMEYFCEGTINTNKLSEVVFDILEDDRTPLEVDLNSTLRNTYKTEVAKFVREVKDLKLSQHPMIHGIWNDPFRVPSLCFIRLKILIVEKCEFITSIVIPSHILSLLCKLEELVVRQCDSVKKIFEVTHEAKDTMINPLRSGLKKLTIEQLPNLEHVWDSDPVQQISYFQSFQEVYVHGCNNLQRLFPTSVSENLNKLEKLEVIECDRLVEIVTKDEVVVEGAPKEFALQSMTSIKLWSLPELKCFYPALHKLECPKLEEVHLFHCEKLKIFQFESQEFQCPQAENQAIFLPEKVIPYLKFLAVSKEEIMMMLHGQFHVNNLSNLEALQLQCFHDDSDTFSYEVLGQLPNIENLAVNCSSFKEIFYSESPNMDDGKGILPHLKCLQLIKLSKLKSIGLEHAWMDLISKNLEKLLIDQCHCLRSIVPSKVSFSSLIELNISECNGLVSLFTPSTSRTLHQLKNMSVKDCESLEEIVSKETEESSELVEEEIIVFPKLKTLSICSLPNLGRFYNGNTALKFPLLDKFSLIDCQKMESFCAGAVSVNRWTEVEFEEDKDPVLLEVDLNSAIPKAFEGMFY